MFAVVGTWKMDAAMREGRQAALPGLVEGVRQNPGFVTGYWSDDVEEPDVSVTYIVFETRDQAESFRRAALANAPGQAAAGVDGQGLRIVEVTANA